MRRNEAGEIVNMIGFTSDISDRKRLEKELEKRNQELNLFSHTDRFSRPQSPVGAEFPILQVRLARIYHKRSIQIFSRI